MGSAQAVMAAAPPLVLAAQGGLSLSLWDFLEPSQPSLRRVLSGHRAPIAAVALPRMGWLDVEPSLEGARVHAEAYILL
jgi:hypothetical protein